MLHRRPGPHRPTQRDALTALGVTPKRIYVDHGLTGSNRARPGLREASAACRAGNTLVVTKLDQNRSAARASSFPAGDSSVINTPTALSSRPGSPAGADPNGSLRDALHATDLAR